MNKQETAEYNKGVLVGAFLMSLGCITQGYLYNDLALIQIFSILFFISAPTYLGFIKKKQKNRLVWKILIILAVLAIIIGAVFNSGLLSGIFGLLGLWPVHLFYKNIQE